MAHITLFLTVSVLPFYITSTSRNACAVHDMAAICISLISCFPDMFLRYFLNNSEIVPVDPVSFGFTFQMRFISVVSSLYRRVFSASFLITILSPENAASINIHVHVPYLLSIITIVIIIIIMVGPSGCNKQQPAM